MSTTKTFASAVLVALFALGCAMEDEGATSELEFIDGDTEDGSGLIGTTRMQYEGSCDFLLNCSAYSRRAGHVAWGCGGSECNSGDRFVAVPDWRTYMCGEVVTICKAGTDRCTTAKVKDISCCGKWEASAQVFRDLGVPFSENIRNCSGAGEARVTIYRGTGDVAGEISGSAGSGAFNGTYCAQPGYGCGGNSPCWAECPEGSSCDFANDTWGYCTGGSSTADGTEPGGFNGTFCAQPGYGCGGNSPCWADCPAGSSCDFENDTWGHCIDG